MNYKSLLPAAFLFSMTLTLGAHAEVRVIVGATPIGGGDARAKGDITLINEKLAVALAVESTVPYGVPRGAIVDVAPVRKGSVGQDQVVYSDFIPDNWSAWPNTYQRVEIIERGPEQARVRTVRDWGKVTVTTLYTLRANTDRIEIETTMRNDGTERLSNLLSGLTLWPRGGFLFGVPGLLADLRGEAVGAQSDRVVAYDENWSIALHAPYFDNVGAGSKDMFRRHSLAPGESRSFTGWLQVGASGDLAPIVNAEIERRQLASAVVSGAVRARDGALVERPVIVIEKQGKPYAWALGNQGRYRVRLPEGDYALYATARNYSQSPATTVSVRSGASNVCDFGNLEQPATIAFGVTDAGTRKPLDARIAIVEGQKPLVEFLGRKVFFTELAAKGRVELAIAPGRYVFNVSAGGGFLGPPAIVTMQVQPNQKYDKSVALKQHFAPRARGWYSADLHHHADQAEAVTPPKDLARSQLAAGLDLLFVSDHDSTVNLPLLQRIATARGMGFIPSIELSPSWGHFNAYPLQLDAKLSIDVTTATIDDILREGRRMGAIAIQANHPYIPYGYMASLAAGVAPGGFNPGFDLLEINAGTPQDDTKVLQQLWQFWNSGHRVYLTAGTDTHDVWNDESGRVRVFAHLDGPATGNAFARALRNGHAYVSFGPLIFPSVLFGDTLRLKPGATFTLSFDLQSVAGIHKVDLISGGAVVKSQSFGGAETQEVHVDFPLTANSKTWYSLLVEDREGKKAYANPIWIDLVNFP